jgi:preprotein translocase subunit SecB
MAEESNGPTEPAAPAAPAAPQPRLQIITQYVRDMSFENIAAQKGVAADGKPDIKVSVNIDAQKRPEDRYEVSLKVKVDSKVADKQIFILELDYAGLFLIQNVPDDQLHALLMIEYPRLIFPFVRRIVGDISRDGGFPPLNLEMIDFLALYRNEIARRQAEAAAKKTVQA